MSKPEHQQQLLLQTTVFRQSAKTCCALLPPLLAWRLYIASEGKTASLYPSHTRLNAKKHLKNCLKICLSITATSVLSHCCFWITKPPSAWSTMNICRLEWELGDSCIRFYQSKVTRRAYLERCKERNAASSSGWDALYRRLQMWWECSAELITVTSFTEFQTYHKSFNFQITWWHQATWLLSIQEGFLLLFFLIGWTDRFYFSPGSFLLAGNTFQEIYRQEERTTKWMDAWKIDLIRKQ